MNIIIMTQDVTRIVEPLLNSRHNVVGIVEARSDIPRSFFKQGLWNIAKGATRRIKGQEYSLRAIAKANKIPYYFMNNGSDSQLAQWIQEKAPDVMVVYSVPELLKPNVFTIPKRGTINLHPALLPKYRGPDPFFWMSYDMDLCPGVTVHYIDIGEDSGDIIYQQTFALPLGAKLPETLDQAIGIVGVELLLKALDAIENGTSPREPQPKGSPTVRARNVKIEEYPRLIDWENWPIERVWHFLRGTELWLSILYPLPSWPPGMRWSVVGMERTLVSGKAHGQLYQEEGRWFIACRDGRILLEKSFNFLKLVSRLTR